MQNFSIKHSATGAGEVLGRQTIRWHRTSSLTVNDELLTTLDMDNIFFIFFFLKVQWTPKKEDLATKFAHKKCKDLFI